MDAMHGKLPIIFTLVLIGSLVLAGWLAIFSIQPPTMIPKTGRETENLSKELIPLTEEKTVLLPVPFTSQAPFANWDDAVFQYACEEASILMAMRWVQGRMLTEEEAQKEIAAISDFEKNRYGHFYDLSAEDTANLIKDYFNYHHVSVRFNIDAMDITSALVQGNVVIVPVNGQKLSNPFYTPPGPSEHMLVVIGHDAKTQEFITNDPGTRRGEKFPYPAEVLEAALRDYSTGFHEPVEEIDKVMIIVEPPIVS